MKHARGSRQPPSRETTSHRLAVVLVGVLAAAGCSSKSNGDTCQPGDQDGVTGATSGTDVVLVSVSDTGFTIGGVDSGSTEPNISFQNLTTVTLKLTNVGTKPHDLVFHCIPSGLPSGCATTSCFPPTANVPMVSPGESATTTFKTPAVEGGYPFTSDDPGDTGRTADGGFTGLVGEFVLM